MKKLFIAFICASLLSACGAAPATIGADVMQDFPESVAVATVPEEPEIADNTLSTELGSGAEPSESDTEPAAGASEPPLEIYTPENEIPEGLRLEVEASDTYATYRIINGTENDVTFGDINDYSIEVFDAESDGSWIGLEAADRPVSLILITLPAGEVSKCTVGWSGVYGRLPEGRYRLVKSVNAGGEEPVYLYAEFQISGGDDSFNGRLINSFDGVDLEVSGVSPTGLKYSLKNNGGSVIDSGTEYDFTVQSYGENGWENVPGEWAVDSAAVLTEPGKSFDAEIDWSGFYGELPKGKYRLVKSFSVETSPEWYENFCAAAEFEIGSLGGFTGETDTRTIAAYIGDDVTGVKITHVLMGQLTERSIEGDDIEALRLWANGLEYELREFEEGNTPGDGEGQEVYLFELTGGSCPGFDYIICGPDDCYLLIENNWYIVKNPSGPPVEAP